MSTLAALLLIAGFTVGTLYPSANRRRLTTLWVRNAPHPRTEQKPQTQAVVEVEGRAAIRAATGPVMVDAFKPSARFRDINEAMLIDFADTYPREVRLRAAVEHADRLASIRKGIASNEATSPGCRAERDRILGRPR